MIDSITNEFSQPQGSLPLTKEQAEYIESAVEQLRDSSKEELLGLVRRLLAQSELTSKRLNACIKLLSPEQIDLIFKS